MSQETTIDDFAPEVVEKILNFMVGKDVENLR
jgi:hypothetical protein